jgi:hypothetical protein
MASLPAELPPSARAASSRRPIASSSSTSAGAPAAHARTSETACASSSSAPRSASFARPGGGGPRSASVSTAFRRDAARASGGGARRAALPRGVEVGLQQDDQLPQRRPPALGDVGKLAEREARLGDRCRARDGGGERAGGEAQAAAVLGRQRGEDEREDLHQPGRAE